MDGSWQLQTHKWMVAAHTTHQQPTSMEITVMSKEMIKPSTPTPHHLKHLTPSLIDQYMIPTYFARILLFYSARGDVQRFQTTNMSHRLRQSLSKVLSEFYPLAGRFNNVNQSIECTDHGLEYIEARVKAPLTLGQLLACPKPEELDRLIPYDACNYGTKGFKGLSAVQVTVFDECGGMAVGVSLSHQLADAASLAVFINTWAAIARGEDRDETATAKFGFASLFPPRVRDIPAQNYDEGDTQSACRKLVVKRFVFSQSNIDSLKGKFEYHRPTRVEVVSALLIKCLINAIKSGSSKPILSGIVVNLRTRMNPPLPMHYVGNMVLSLVMNQVESESESLNVLGVELRRLIKEIDSDYLEKLQADNGLLLFEILEQQAKVDVRIVGVTSWCKFPVYEVDVGWGAPTWAAPVHPNWEDCIVLMDGKNGEGIEAWATLGEGEMALFESDSELLEFACHNPMVCEF